MTEMKIVSIDEEPPKNGNVLLRITAESRGKKYEVGVDMDDYLDDHTRGRVHKMLLERIAKDQAKKPRNNVDAKALLDSLRGSTVKTNG